MRSYHPWVCTAAPLRDPVDGRLLGLVDVCGPVTTAHPSTLALVDSVAKLACLALRDGHNQALDRLRNVAMPKLVRLSRPAVVTDRNGWVAAAEGLWIGERIILPASMSTGVQYITPIGRCIVEPLFDGWLIREACGESSWPTVLRLDLRGEPPTIEVLADSGSWRHRLSLRHAEILLSLVTAPTGRSAAELSSDLFGDTSHTGTMRAELSRRRRRLGSVLESNPYRLPSWIQASCELPEDPATLLPLSTAPFVQRMRFPNPAG